MPTIRLSGRVAIEDGGQQIEMSGRQARVVFAYLMLERHRAVPREELADALWPGTLPPSWEAALRVVVSKVRSALARAGCDPATVVTNAFGCYQLHLPVHTVVDVEVAMGAVDAAERAFATNDLHAAVASASEARVIANRPFLAGEGGDWAERTRTKLRGCLLRSLEVLSQASARLGHGVDALHAAEEAVAIDPFRESGHRCLMAAHAASGNRAAALKAYEVCRRLLASELGVGPSAETEAAYLAYINADAPAVEAPISAPTAGPAAPFPDVLRTSIAPSLVGREPELRGLSKAWAAARESRRQVVLIAGEAGMGKTALAAQAALGFHAEGASVLFGRCDRDVLIPYHPFVEAVDRYVRTCPQDRLREEVGPDGTDLARLIVDLPRWLPEATLPAPAEPETERHRLFGAVTSFFHGASRTAPVVLILDDVQWIGKAAFVLLRHLLRALETSPVLIVACYRDDELDEDARMAGVFRELVREPGVAKLDLLGLDEKAVAHLLLAGSELDTIPMGLAATVQEQTLGNPLFVTELVRHLQDSPWPTLALDAADAWAVIGTPQTIQEVLLQRCERVGAVTRQVIEVAAVLGHRFDLRSVLQVSQHQEEIVIGALEESGRARLTQEIPGTVGAFVFAHAFTRDVVYSRLGGARRAYIHRRAAEALEAAHGQMLPEVSAELAHHFEAAGETARATSYAIIAGDHAAQRLAYEGATMHYERALRLGGDTLGDEQRCAILMPLAAAHRKSGNVGAARTAYLEATKLARRLGDPELLARCALGIAGGGRAVSAWIADEVRVSLLEEALALLDNEDSDLRARVMAELAKALYFSPEDQRREALAQEAVEVARRVGHPTALAGALSATRVIRWGPSNTELRLVYGSEVLALSEQSGDDELLVRARLARIADLIETGDRSAMDLEIDAALLSASDLRQPYYLWRAMSWDALRAMIGGRFDEAEQRVEDSLEIWRGRSHPDATDCSMIQRAAIALAQHQPDEAVALLRSVAERHPIVPAYRCLLAVSLVRAGRTGEAQAEFDCFAADGFVSPPIDSGWLMGAAALAETCAALRDEPRARVLYDLLVPFADRFVVLESFGGGAAFSGSLRGALAALAGTMGEWDDMQEHLDAARRMNSAFGAVQPAPALT